jgi:hypothetical protein
MAELELPERPALLDSRPVIESETAMLAGRQA